jgi:hypothetical protein
VHKLEDKVLKGEVGKLWPGFKFYFRFHAFS